LLDCSNCILANNEPTILDIKQIEVEVAVDPQVDNSDMICVETDLSKIEIPTSVLVDRGVRVRKTTLSGSTVIPARVDVDLSFMKNIVQDEKVHSQPRSPRVTSPDKVDSRATQGRQRAKAVLKPKVVAPKCTSGVSRAGIAATFDQVKTHANRVQVGFADTVGRRQSNEDQILVIGEEFYDIIGIFDGHNGPNVSKFISENIGNIIKEGWLACSGQMNEEIFYDIFNKTNLLIKESGIQGGSTALLIAITDKDIYIANAGDCRCVIGKGDNVKRITTDHKPDNDIEKARIENCGGHVTFTVREGHSVSRVNGILGVARAMGDFELEGYITCIPDVFKLECSLLNEGNFLVAACDGLWDVLEDNVVVDTVSTWLSTNIDDVEGASKKLRDEAYTKGSTDNISVVVVKK